MLNTPLEKYSVLPSKISSIITNMRAYDFLLVNDSQKRGYEIYKLEKSLPIKDFVFVDKRAKKDLGEMLESSFKGKIPSKIRIVNSDRTKDAWWIFFQY